MSVLDFDHHIQNEIFSKLRNSQIARYKDLKPPDMEPSQFTYHLQELMHRHLVEKVEKGKYRLTPQGVLLSQHYSSQTQGLRLAPLTYTLIFIRSTKNRWLIVKRNKHPYIDMYACISGKIHMHETLEEASIRELQEATDGTIDQPLEYIAYTSILLLSKNKEISTHITGPIWFLDGVEESNSFENIVYGEVLWSDWRRLPYEEFIPGWKEIIEVIEQRNTPFLDLKLRL